MVENEPLYPDLGILVAAYLEAPEAASATLRLLGVPPGVTDDVLEAADVLAAGGVEHNDDEYGVIVPELQVEELTVYTVNWSRVDILPGIVSSALSRLRELWSRMQWLPDATREPSVQTITPTLYGIAVDPRLPAVVQDSCAWSTERSTGKGISVSLGVVGLEASDTTTVKVGRTLVATPGRSDRVYTQATVALRPTRLDGRPTEQESWLATDMRFRTKPTPIGTEPFAVLPHASNEPAEIVSLPSTDSEGPLREAHMVEQGRKYSFKLGLGDKGEIGVSLSFNATMSVEHSITRPSTLACELRSLEGLPGKMLVPSF